MAAELAVLGDSIDSIFVPIGRGTLASGIGGWCHAAMPRTRVVGIQVEDAASSRRSPVETPLLPGRAMPATASDLPSPELSVFALADLLDDTATVLSRHLDQAAAALLTHEGIRASAEGSAALAGAALAAPDMQGARVVVPVTGRRAG